MLRKPAHFIFYLSTLQKPAAGASFCHVLKYKADSFHLSMIQKPAPGYTSSLRSSSSHIKRGSQQGTTVITTGLYDGWRW